MLLQCEDTGRHFGCYGEPGASTPNIDQLAREGTLYTNGFTHAPVCAPSRGGMVTGRYPYSLGNHHMRSNLNFNPGIFTEELRNAGYFVNWHSKLDFNFDPEEGWRDASHAWVEDDPPQQPFFVYENFHRTHESCMFPGPPERHQEILPESAEAAEHNADELEAPPFLTDGPELRYELKRYADSVSLIDAQIGRRLRWLEEHGLRDNTLVILLSDHGRGLPREKRWCYDAGLHLPLIVRFPGLTDPGTVCDDLVAWVDIAPTLLHLAGAPIPDTYQGQVFLGDDAGPERDCVFGGRDRMDEVFDRVRVARDKKWHYIRNDFPELPWAQCQNYMEQQPIMPLMREKWKAGELEGDEAAFFADRKPPEELFDMENDPWCMRNLAEDPDCANILNTMRKRLEAHLTEVGDLGLETEESLIERGILTDKLSHYRTERPPVLQPDDHPGPQPYPVTLRDAEAFREKGSL
jgi:arylsulfatase A-like enzyme